MQISATSKVCAVIGDPVEHSLSPQIHNAAFNSCGLDMAYAAFHVRKGDVRRAMEGVRALGIRGLSVTIPHKVDVIPCLDEVDPVAKAVGSVNTVVNESGHLFGYSTDGPGALRAIAAAGVEAAGAKILVLGSGGAARAVAFSLVGLSPRPNLQILGVEPDEMSRLQRDLESHSGCAVQAELLGDATLARAMEESLIIVHATPVGMTPRTDQSLVPVTLLRPEHVVFDIVYTPLETQLLKDAKNAGATVIPGLGMFVYQAAIQFELWTGQAAPVDLMYNTVTSALEDIA